MAAIIDALNAVTGKLDAIAQGLGHVVKEIARSSAGGASDAKRLTALERTLKGVFESATREGVEGAVNLSKKAIVKAFADNVLEGVTRGVVKGVEKVQKRIHQAFQAALSGLKSPRGFVEGIVGGFGKGMADVAEQLGKKFAKVGKSIQVKGGKKGGFMGGAVVKNLGRVLRMMGPLVTLLGSVGSLFSGIIGMLIDAEAQAKGLNKALLEGGVAGGDIGGNIWELGDALGAARKAATDLRNNFEWGTVAKDQMEILGAFNEAGYVLKEMTSDVTNAKSAMQDYQDVTRVALTYSKLLGVSAREIATQQAEYMESLGSSLSFVESQFNAVYKVAQLSGFGVKRFYGMVQQATSGMSMYNSRLDEAAGLLVRLGKILGSRVAGDFLQELKKGFVDESMTDRFKRVMTTGSGKMEKIFENSADDIAFAFGQKFEETTPAMQKALEGAGVSIDFGMLTDPKKGDETRKQLVSQLGKMDPKKQAVLLAKIRREDEGMSRELSKLIKVSEGAAGGMDNMSRNMGALDMGGVLAAKLGEFADVISTPLAEMDAEQLAAFEAGTGVSGEQLEILKEVDKGIRGNFSTLKEIAADPAAAYANKTQEEIRALQQKDMDAFGAFVDQNGRIVQAQLDEQGGIVPGTERAIESLGEYIQSQGDMIARASEVGLEENTAFAKAIASNTTDLATMMEIGVQGVLEKIYSVMLDIWSYMSGEEGISAEERRKALAESQEAEKRFLNARAAKEKEVADKQIEMDKASGDEKVKLEEELKALQEHSANLLIGALTEKESQRDISSAMDRKSFEEAKAGKFEQMMAAVENTKGVDAAESIRKSVEGTLDSMTSGLTEDAASLLRDAVMQDVVGVTGGGLAQGRSIEELVGQQLSTKGIAETAGKLAADLTTEQVGVSRPGGLFEGAAYATTKGLWGGAGVDIEAGRKEEKLSGLQAELKGLAELPAKFAEAGGKFYQVQQAAGAVSEGTLQEFRTQRGLGVGMEFLDPALEVAGQKAFDEVYQEGVGNIVEAEEAADLALRKDMGRQINLQEDAAKQRKSLHEESLSETVKMNAKQAKQIADEFTKSQLKSQLMQAALRVSGPGGPSKEMMELIELASTGDIRALITLSRMGIAPGGGMGGGVGSGRPGGGGPPPDQPPPPQPIGPDDVSDGPDDVSDGKPKKPKKPKGPPKREDYSSEEAFQQAIMDFYGTTEGLKRITEREERLDIGDLKRRSKALQDSGMSVAEFNKSQKEQQDFILRPGGQVVPFSGRDTILGAKSGGPLDRLLQEGVGGARPQAAQTAGKNTTININITGDTATVYRTVKQVFKEAGLIQR